MARMMQIVVVGVVFCVLTAACSSEKDGAQVQTGVAENGDSFSYGKATTLALPSVTSEESQQGTPSDTATAETGTETDGKKPPATSPLSDVPLVIYDTDMGPDIDDAPGLAMLHGYETDGKMELAAVTISRRGDDGAQFTDAVNTFYGRPDIPIGQYQKPTQRDSGIFNSVRNNFEYDMETAPAGYKVQRQVLADAEKSGRKVIMIQVGFSSNISELLDSEADEVSDKSGMELVEENVSLLSIMAGAPTNVEFNIEKNLPAAENLFAKWPVDMVASYWGVGGHIHYPYTSIQKLPNDHIIRQAYEFGGPGKNFGWHERSGDYYNMKSWDLTSILHAMEPEENYFDISTAGTIRLENGVAKFSEGAGGRHYILSDASNYPAEKKKKATDAMAAMIR